MTAPSVEYLRNMTMYPDPRLAIPADRQAIEEIVRQAYSPYMHRIGRQPGPMLDDYEALIGKGRVYVVEREGTIQGILVLVPEQDAMLLDNVAVAPSARGTGIGRSLLEYAERSARAAGYRYISVTSRHRVGWQRWGELGPTELPGSAKWAQSCCAMPLTQSEYL
ncbi:GNAT family N-acetyltransferase [Paraburkholderia sediminicola]|uniref:GNAT family N-acetyltransferase n=1 Tax=Paraburkholderia sediminicola TaxID=458836 RepID=UPI0038B716DD